MHRMPSLPYTLSVLYAFYAFYALYPSRPLNPNPKIISRREPLRDLRVEPFGGWIGR